MVDKTLQRLIDSYREDGSGESRSKWIALSREFFASRERPSVLSALGDDSCVVMYGSTTRNVDDPSSDLDFYLLLDDEGAARFDSISECRFVDLIINGKPGHLNVTPFADVENAFAKPHLETIYELQHAVPVLDPSGRFTRIADRARLPMHEALRRAALLFNYVEMRSYHRSADNPMNRNDKLSALSGVIETINYSIRCALVIDGRAFPYTKWLYVAAAGSPTGSLLLEGVDRILHLVQTDATSLMGPEKENAISSQLRQIRAIIVDCAKASGIDEPWLNQWWHFFDAQRTAFDGIEWPV